MGRPPTKLIIQCEHQLSVRGIPSGLGPEMKLLSVTFETHYYETTRF